ncbi:hypothetical protein ACQ4PT_071040 [Festuca glaucescens]
MVLVDWIDLSSDDEDDDGPMVQEDHAPGHAAQIKVETVDLTMEEEEDVDEGDNNAHFVSPKQKFLQAARGVEQAMQPGKQVLVTPDAQEAMQPGNQVLVAAVDCMEETMHSPSAAGDAPSSFTERGAAADDRAEEAMQSKHADEAAASSTMTEQDASSCLSMSEQAATPSSSSTHHQNHKADALLCSPPIATAVPFPRQFWKAGEYKVAAQASINNGQNCLRINPKFLHSNATSHKWAFGAIAELLDNAVDEVQNGATYVKIDKLKYSPGEYSLVIQDGNGFKTSTMRLGADSIIFSCRQDNRLTRSVGLLSYTFLTRTGCNDILVPVFGDMGCHGTKVFVFNLWFSDAWEMELDFTTDDEDIMISGAPEIPDERMKVGRLNYMHIANRFRYSLRVYASILYLRLPEHFKVILCGRVVEPHHIVNDLIYRECVEYRPRVGVSAQADVITTIGFLKGAPKLNIYGFNIYHRNRLILPFWSACSERGRGRGRGIVGVLEANFIRPTHDKQDFEKTELFQRLDTRLKDMTTEYWRYHAHLIGQQQVTKAHPPAHYASVAVIDDDSSATRATTKTYAGNSRIKTSVVLDPCFNEEPCKRRNSDSVNETRAQKRQNTNDDVNYPGSGGAVEVGKERSRVLIYQNKTLKAECSVLEAAGQQLLSKANELSNELREFQRLLRSLTDELQFHDGLNALQHTTPMASSSYMGVGWI